MTKPKTKKKVTENEVTKPDVTTKTEIVSDKEPKQPRRKAKYDKICFEEFRAVAAKTFTAIDIRPQGQMAIYLQIMYTMLATCFPEKFEDIVIHQASEPPQPPKVYYNTFSRKDILNPYGIDPARVKRHPVGSWPGYLYEPPREASQESRNTPTK
jgi:hypothetical protein